MTVISLSLFTFQTTDENEPEIVTAKDGRILTGIPQIDYVYDPNLPRELNGFNLSSYPFLDSVPLPEEMLFKCDEKLKDGFYADVQYGCQVNIIHPMPLSVKRMLILQLFLVVHYYLLPFVA